jgi:hypothetical protein
MQQRKATDRSKAATGFLERTGKKMARRMRGPNTLSEESGSIVS